MSQWMSEIRARLAAARLEPAREAEIAQELSEHIDDRYTELRASGMSDADARRMALDELKDASVMRDQLRVLEEQEDPAPVTLGDTARRSFVADLWQDARYAVRVLGANRAFTVLSVLTLALGIGATTAVYAIVDTLLLRPLPYPNPERLVSITETSLQRPASSHAPSYPNFADWRARSRSLEFVGLRWFGRSLILTDGAAPERASSGSVTRDFFQVFGYTPILGRGFSDDDALESAEPVAILSYGAWQRRYAGDPAVIGRTFHALDGTYRIVGILPEAFAYSRNTDFWLSIRMSPMLRARGAGQYTVYGRLRPEVTLQQARAELDEIARQLAAQYPATNKTTGVLLLPLQETTVGYAKPTLTLLLGATGCILLIGCLNVAGLLVARGAGRAREIAVRTSLGAGRWRIVRQLTTESVVLALLGGTGGVLLAWCSMSALIPLLPVQLPGDVPVTVDLRVVAVALLASGLTGLLFGAAPALHLARTGCAGALKDGSGATSRWGSRLGTILVLVEVALALILLAGAGLMVQTLRALNGVEPGIDVDHTLAVMVSPLLPRGSDPHRRTAFYASVLEQVATTPGVEAAAAIDTLPFNSTAFTIATVDSTDVKQQVSPRYVTPAYFRTMALPVVAGRAFSTADAPGAPCVVIVNQFGAGQLWPGRSALGHTVRLGNEGAACDVVGVVGDVHHQGPVRAVVSEIYRPALQEPALDLTIVARAANPAVIAAAVAAQVSRVAERTLPARVVTLASMNDRYKEDAKHRAILLGLLGAIGVVLAAVGVFGLTAYSVAQRTKEIGVRVALGATRTHVISTIVGALAPFLAGGVALGLFGAWGASRIVAQFLFGVTPTDRVTLLSVSVLLAIVALAACYIPARRALRVDPVKALRAE